jgi:hypothetical protein
MPTYDVSDPESGLSATLDGDSPPTEQELIDVFKALSPSKKDAQSTSLIERIIPTAGMSALGEAMKRNQLPKEGVPAVTVPRVGEEGTWQRGVSEGVSGLIESATTPENIAMLGAMTVPVVGPVL